MKIINKIIVAYKKQVFIWYLLKDIKVDVSLLNLVILLLASYKKVKPLYIYIIVKKAQKP